MKKDQNQSDQWKHIKERRVVLDKLEKAASRAKGKVTFYDNKLRKTLADYHALRDAAYAERTYFSQIVDEACIAYNELREDHTE